MVTPRQTDHVWAYKRQGGHVTVHISDVDGWHTRCNRAIPWHDYRWLWVMYRTLNPEMVSVCKRCLERKR